jgi:hypothetical protein
MSTIERQWSILIAGACGLLLAGLALGATAVKLSERVLAARSALYPDPVCEFCGRVPDGSTGHCRHEGPK